MKHFLFLACVLPLAAQPAGKYEIRPAPGSRFTLEVFKSGLMSGKKHILEFEKYSGVVEYQASAPEKSKVELTVESGAIVVKDDWVSAKQLKDIREEAVGKNVLQADKFPTMRFVSSSIVASGDGFTAAGTLTIRGVAKPVTVSVKLKPSGNSLAIEGKSEVKLRDYGIKPPGPPIPVISTKNEMALSFSVVAVPAR